MITKQSPIKKACNKKWAALIKKIFEVDPLCCPRCSHQMRIISTIDQPEIIEKILKHLDLWQPQTHSPPLSEENKIVEETIYYPSLVSYSPFYLLVNFL